MCGDGLLRVGDDERAFANRKNRGGACMSFAKEGERERVEESIKSSSLIRKSRGVWGETRESERGVTASRPGRLYARR